MSDSAMETPSRPPGATIEEIVRSRSPMGDLSAFVIDDLTEAEEAEFFSAIADA